MRSSNIHLPDHRLYAITEGTQNPAPLFDYTGGFATHGNAPTFMQMMTANLDTFMDKKNRRRVLEKVGLYDICKPIGKGNFAVVRLAKHRIAKCKVAIKIVDKQRIDKDNLVKIEREIRILKTLEHPHIIKLYEVMRTEQYIYIVTEFAPNGELFEVLAARGKLSETESRVFFQQIVSAIAYCHHRGIVHRDIKAENILIDKDNNVKLIDFGFSNIQQPKVLMSTWCGSPPYAAPELLLGRVYDGTKADIWSLGVVLFIMVTGGFPFAGENIEKLKSAVVAGQLKIPFWVSPDCYDLLRKMIIIPPERRLPIDAVAQHRWTIVEMPDKLRKLVKEEPFDRLLPENPSFHLNKSICYCMHRDGNWSEAQIAEEVMRKNYESPIYATYELFLTKLKGKSDVEEPTDVPLQPRRGSRGSITTGKANIDDEPPAPTISARSLAILGLSDSDEGSDGDYEKDDFTLSPAESWLRHAAQLGPVAGVDEPNTSFSRAEARRHTLVGISELDNLFSLQQQLADKNSLAAAFMAVNQAAVAAYASKLVNPYMLPTPNMLMQDTLSQYNRILTLPSFERRASAGDPSKFISPNQLTDQFLNAAMNANGLFPMTPGGPSTSNAAAHKLHPSGHSNLTAEEEGEIYLKRFGHSKRNTFHCLGGSPANSSGLSSARRGPYTRQLVPHERRSSWTSTQQNLSAQQQAQLERLYRQSVGGGDQATTNIQQLQKEFKELNACFQAQGQAFGQKAMDAQIQSTCPPMISITDENNCVQLPVPPSFINQDPTKNQENQAFETDDVSEEPHPGPSSQRAMELMPPSENSTLISYLDTDIVLQQLRNTLDNLDIAYRETGYENHRICVENGVKSRIEIGVFPVPLSISQAKSRIEFSCTGSDTTGCGELCTELIKKLRIFT